MTDSWWTFTTPSPSARWARWWTASRLSRSRCILLCLGQRTDLLWIKPTWRGGKAWQVSKRDHSDFKLPTARRKRTVQASESTEQTSLCVNWGCLVCSVEGCLSFESYTEFCVYRPCQREHWGCRNFETFLETEPWNLWLAGIQKTQYSQGQLRCRMYNMHLKDNHQFSSKIGSSVGLYFILCPTPEHIAQWNGWPKSFEIKKDHFRHKSNNCCELSNELQWLSFWQSYMFFSSWKLFLW